MAGIILEDSKSVTDKSDNAPVERMKTASGTFYQGLGKVLIGQE
jgi:hypothetical protein